MLNIYKTVDNALTHTEIIEDGVWIDLVRPTPQEIQTVSAALDIDSDLIKAALDEEERSRIETDNCHSLILVDIPVVDKETGFSTIPLGIILANHAIITICLRGDTLLEDFASGKVKTFLTQFRTRFVLQILHRNAALYLRYLKHIDKMSNKIENELHKSMKNKELIQMLNLQKSLVFFSTSLKSNEGVLKKLTRQESIKKYPEDADLLSDVIIENEQAIEMANIYSSILSGTMDALASVISNNLNIVMKFLTSVTIVMAIPTMIASFFGMNVDMPFSIHGTFWGIMAASLVVSLIVGYTLYKKDMF